MGINAEIERDFDAALAALAWQLDMGVDETLSETAINAYELPDRAEWQKATVAPAPQPQPSATPAQKVQTSPSFAIDAASKSAAACQNLDDLREALARFEHLELKKGARDMVFGAGHPQADVLILGDAPDRDDEREKSPFAGQQGVFLDSLFAAIGLSRDNPDPAQAIYLTCVLPWRTPQDRTPEMDELAIMRPFVAKHIALIAPKVVVLMGNAALQMGLNTQGIARARGKWARAFDTQSMAMLTPQNIVQSAIAKREAWDDLLQIKAALR
jgi:uracil-DNA glycosylase